MEVPCPLFRVNVIIVVGFEKDNMFRSGNGK